ncbi:hypothetical protein [Burkholderia oklahomensis]|uniref:hypothetical protein n=1 Tax=Burkholderia oklahomensis TaxID=342113 RepID=UPI000D3A0CA9|nr:hypothetical protein [Burkholderia oklahomensis]MBI0359270.1 hypothetical protein [Burkholderia oklahomensis]MDN7675686.1 hypothetical protein [Burkholderia oklahomensis]QPS39293.1 hypothetical protein I6G57_10750 [Burkholderia oklahomensis]
MEAVIVTSADATTAAPDRPSRVRRATPAFRSSQVDFPLFAATHYEHSISTIRGLIIPEMKLEEGIGKSYLIKFFLIPLR